MKFKEGQIVKHKLNETKVVIIKCLPRKWYRNKLMYICSYGEDPKLLKKEKRSDFLIYNENELELVKKDLQATNEVKK